MTIAEKTSKAMTVTKERGNVPWEDCWNVEALYHSWEAWEEDLKTWGREECRPRWPEIERYKGKLGDPFVLCALLEVLLQIDRSLTKLYTYAHLRHDEDVASELGKKAYSRITALFYEFRQETAWVEPEILALSDGKVSELISADILQPYRFYLERVVRMKPHTLTAEKEELLALAGKALETSYRTFSSFNNADLKFPAVEDSLGNMRELTHGKYLLYLQEKDRKLREGAFKNLHRSFLGYENTLCELINGQVQGHLFEAKARHYPSCLEAALFPNQIDTSVYLSLIEAVRQGLPAMHRYLYLRKKALGYDSLHFYDLHVPLTKEAEIKMNYEEAVELVVEAMAPLGAEYQKILRKGLTFERWVDRYENARKRSGAYSSGCYDSMPYILMNYHGAFSDVMTLCHEAGHSMHSFMTCRHQPYHYSQYPIFLAEVASTFQEEMLLRHLLARCKSKEEKAYLINKKIDDLRGTLFRQTQFAEFELRLHQWAEEGMPLTPALLKEESCKLNKKYYGPALTDDEEIAIEWSRIPHFYYNFYVYQYATGISAAHALVEKVLEEGPSAKERYLSFLSSGSRAYPLDILARAGVDMRKPDAVQSVVRQFDLLVGELEKLLLE
ncbi:MAG TPA: oligoendopeptidase F [Rhabdochlamydiaceae bacterium]|nr:oligoendopeptidase F [Rhabdochlamydiaceae bacterium]